MTAPTREQVLQWANDAKVTEEATDAELERFAALAFAAGQPAPSGSGAELVREIEENPFPGEPYDCRVVLQDYWPRLRAALISGDAAREDAERWRELVPLMVKHPDSSCWFSGPPLGAGDDFVVAFDRARGGKSNA